jgi:hypothetical protein
LNTHSQNLTDDAPGIHMVIRDVSRQWRVPAELVSAMLAMPTVALKTGLGPQSVTDMAKRLAIAWNRAPII